MELNEVKTAIYTIVCEIQHLSGRTLPANFCDNTIPIGGIDGFDSLNAIEVTAHLSERLNCVISENPFVTGNKPLTLEQTAQKIFNKITNRRKENGSAN